jgi:hypothetical protein
MPDGIVELKSFPDEPSAWLARAVLAAHGIAAQVLSDGSYPHLHPRVRLAVRAEDAQVALELLESRSDGPSA